MCAQFRINFVLNGVKTGRKQLNHMLVLFSFNKCTKYKTLNANRGNRPSQTFRTHAMAFGIYHKMLTKNQRVFHFTPEIENARRNSKGQT